MSSIPVKLPENFFQSATSKEDRRLREAVGDFEAMFVKQLFSEMRKSTPDSGLFAPNQGEKMFQELLDGEYATAVSRRPQGLGLKESMYANLTRDAAPNGATASQVENQLRHAAKSINNYPAVPIDETGSADN